MTQTHTAAALALSQVGLAALVARTSDAYSFERYGVVAWAKAAVALAAKGYDEQEIEIVLRSKQTRWSADVTNGKEYPMSAAKADRTVAELVTRDYGDLFQESR
jgi:hypothetical protein